MPSEPTKTVEQEAGEESEDFSEIERTLEARQDTIQDTIDAIEQGHTIEQIADRERVSLPKDGERVPRDELAGSVSDADKNVTELYGDARDLRGRVGLKMASEAVTTVGASTLTYDAIANAASSADILAPIFGGGALFYLVADRYVKGTVGEMASKEREAKPLIENTLEVDTDQSAESIYQAIADSDWIIHADNDTEEEKNYAEIVSGDVGSYLFAQSIDPSSTFGDKVEVYLTSHADHELAERNGRFVYNSEADDRDAKISFGTRITVAGGEKENEFYLPLEAEDVIEEYGLETSKPPRSFPDDVDTKGIYGRAISGLSSGLKSLRE